jgi:dolichyl-phosphate-mannose--protein O-mannosyl transferase
MLSASPPQPKKISRHPIPWFGLGMVGIFLFSLVLRFWGLSRFNTLVFDEVYYAKFASAFLKGETVFTGHPPLSTYIIAIGIWLGNHLPWGNGEPKNGLAGLLLSPFSYRWLNALTGAFIPLLVGAIAYQLLHRRSYALIAAFLIALDGLFLVESRYALNNVYLITCGLLGHLFLLLALQAQSGRRWLYLILAGIGFGAAAAIKWNGLGFLLGAYGLWSIGWGVAWIQTIRSAFGSSPTNQQSGPSKIRSPLQNLTQLHVGHVLLGLVIVPALTYYVSWLPYIQVDPSDSNFWQLQAQTYDYHKRVGGLNAHPYCSLWYTWPLMLRPVAYFYKATQGSDEAVPLVGPPLPASASNVIYDVHAMGNPILWWFSTAAVLLLTILLMQQVWQRFVNRPASHEVIESQSSIRYLWATTYLLINWAANLLPWVRVTRCLFIYHYMESLTFAILLLALIIDRWFRSNQPWQKTMAFAVLGLILIGFIFWLPMFLGLPLSPQGLEMRRWLASWI